jgi:hypothetical protein
MAAFFWPTIILPRFNVFGLHSVISCNNSQCFIKAWMSCLSFVTTCVEPCQHHNGHTRDGTLWVIQQNNFGVKHFAVLTDREG